MTSPAMRRAAVAVKMAEAQRAMKLRKEYIRAQDGKCCYCGGHFTAENPATFEHIISRSKGGLTVASNGAASCLACNRERGRVNHEAFRRYKQKRAGDANDQR